MKYLSNIKKIQLYHYLVCCFLNTCWHIALQKMLQFFTFIFYFILLINLPFLNCLKLHLFLTGQDCPILYNKKTININEQKIQHES